MQGQSYTPTCHVPVKTCSGDRDYICPGHIQCIALQQTPSNETFEEILSSKACVKPHVGSVDNILLDLNMWIVFFNFSCVVSQSFYWCNLLLCHSRPVMQLQGVCRLPMTSIASLEQTCCSPEWESGCLLSISPDWSLWALSWHDTSFPNWRCT